MFFSFPALDPRRALLVARISSYIHFGINGSCAGSVDLDPMGRATTVTAADHVEHYGYDASGNITDATRSHTGTLLRTAGATRIEYDAQGRVTERHTRTLSGQVRIWRYVWNSDDRLAAVTTPDGVQWRYTYDALGRRVAKQRLGPDGQAAEQCGGEACPRVHPLACMGAKFTRLSDMTAATFACQVVVLPT